MLSPDEQFTISVLSGGKPKKPDRINAVAIALGPDFFSDIFIIETSDHAKLKLELSYNWYFRIKDNTNQEDLIKIFEVRDFVGDACSTIASRVRGHVAGLSFENFHRFSAKAIRTSIFGLDKEGKVKNDYEFVQNGLIISNIDIRKVEPID
jgi:major vault protein